MGLAFFCWACVLVSLCRSPATARTRTRRRTRGGNYIKCARCCPPAVLLCWAVEGGGKKSPGSPYLPTYLAAVGSVKKSGVPLAIVTNIAVGTLRRQPQTSQVSACPRSRTQRGQPKPGTAKTAFFWPENCGLGPGLYMENARHSRYPIPRPGLLPGTKRQKPSTSRYFQGTFRQSPRTLR